MNLRKILKRLMTERDLKASQLSRATGVPSQTIHNWMSGQSPKNIIQVKTVARHFSVSLDYLLFGEEQRAKAPDGAALPEAMCAGVYEVYLKPFIKK